MLRDHCAPSRRLIRRASAFPSRTQRRTQPRRGRRRPCTRSDIEVQIGTQPNMAEYVPFASRFPDNTCFIDAVGRFATLSRHVHDAPTLDVSQQRRPNYIQPSSNQSPTLLTIRASLVCVWSSNSKLVPNAASCVLEVRGSSILGHMLPRQQVNNKVHYWTA